MDNSKALKLKNKSSVTQLLIAIAGTFAVAYGVFLFNQHLLRTFSLPSRMILMIVTQWLLFLVPGLLMLVNREKISSLGFTKENLGRQIGIGLLIAVSMSLVLTVLPILLGFKDLVVDESYTEIWQFAFEFIYLLFGVALAEELIFRGYIFHKLLEIKNSRWFAIIISSLLFGLFHIFNGNIIQIFETALIGVLYCIFREKIKGCTLLSLIIAHGVYDFLIRLWVSVL